MKVETMVTTEKVASIHYINGIAVNVHSFVNEKGDTVINISIENGSVLDVKMRHEIVSVTARTKYGKK